MEEEISRMKTFLKEYNNDQIQSPTSEEFTHMRVGNYGLDPEDITGQVIDWVLNYLENRKCPYSLALSIAKEAAVQVSASCTTLSQGETEGAEKSSDAAALYEEAISKLPAICNSFLNQTNLEPSCLVKYNTSVFAIKNKRRKMEDRYVIHHDLNAVLDLKDAPHHSYYAVFDGHSGREAASYASAQLHINIAKHPDFLTDTSKAIVEGYQITDLNFLNKCNKWSNIKSGCTVVSALIRESTVYLSWLGDSQAVLVKEGVPLAVTNPHKPDREDEKQRIESLGGHISHVGTWRVNGLLAVTRAIGDPDQKRFISSEPELSVVNLDGTEDFLILACDGLWDGMSPEDVAAVLYRYLEDSSPDEPLDAVAAKLVHQSKLQGSEDNITVIVVFLRDIKAIKENSAKFMANSYCVQGHDFMSMNGSMKTHDLEHASDTPFPKPTVLELNAASSKKLKNAANVMSSAGFGSSYSYQYAENTAVGSFQSLDSSVMGSAQSVFHCQNVTASCFAPEATALSELPTPPIDDMLASQQDENFYSTDLYKEFSNSSQMVEVNSSVDSNAEPNDTFQPPHFDSLSEPVDKVVDSKAEPNDTSQSSHFDSLSEPVGKVVDSNAEPKDTFQSPHSDSLSEPVDKVVADMNNMSLLDTENLSSVNPEAKISPDEAVGVASTVVSTAIETAVKCLSSSETKDSISAQSPIKLNPYAKPFVMKSFFSPEESDSKTCIVSSEVGDVPLKSDEKHVTELNNQFMTDIVSELSAESGINQSDSDNVQLRHFTSDGISPCIAGSTAGEPRDQNVNELSVVNLVASEHSEMETKLSTEPDSSLITKSNSSEQSINQTTGINMNDSPKSELNTSSIPNEAMGNLIETNTVLNITEKHPNSEGSEISVEENLIEIKKQETVCEENKLNISDLTTENINLNLEGKNVTAYDTNAPISDVCKDEILIPVSSKSPTQELQNELNILAGPLQSSLPTENQNSDISFEGLTSENTISSKPETESKCVDIEKCIVDTVEKNTIETSQLLTSLPSEPISLMDIKNELIPAEAEVPSDPSVEDSHAETVAVDLKSLPVGIPEAEGVTEDVDSDSEKDGGWSYMKGNIVSGSKSKPLDKTSKSNENKLSTTSKARKDILKPNLDVKSKMKNAAVDKTKSAVSDKMKTVSVDKSKTAVADKSKSISSVDKTKTLASVDKTRKAVVEKKPDIKTKVMKSSTLSNTTKVTSDKTSRVTGVSSIKKETTETAKTTSTITRSTRPTTLVRANVPASKPVGTSATDRNVAASKVAARSKVNTAITETKSAVKTTNSTLIKRQAVSQTKTNSASTRVTPSRPVTTVLSKTSTIAKSSVQKSVATELKTKQPASAPISTLKKPLTNTAKKPEVKEVKDSVNKQILAKKSTTASKVDSSSSLMSRRVASASTKSTVSRVASSTAKSDASKKDVPKALGLKSTPKNVGSKVSQDVCKGKEKSVEYVQSKTEETKNSINIEGDQKNIAEIVQVAEEKFILETSDKEMVVKEKCEASTEENKIEGSLTSPVSSPEDKTPTVECSQESL